MKDLCNGKKQRFHHAAEQRFERHDVEIADARLLEIVRETLHLSSLPRRIEAYDISNTGDSDINASMVVYKDGRPAKQEYKRYKMKEIESRNDVGSMREVLIRRFTRWKNGDASFSELPDLLLIDGRRADKCGDGGVEVV